MLVSVEKSAHTYPLIDSTDAFTVNILAEDQEEVSRVYASKGDALDQTVTAQVPVVFVQAPPQPPNAAPDPAVAVRVTIVPLA